MCNGLSLCSLVFLSLRYCANHLKHYQKSSLLQGTLTCYLYSSILCRGQTLINNINLHYLQFYIATGIVMSCECCVTTCIRFESLLSEANHISMCRLCDFMNVCVCCVNDVLQKYCTHLLH